MYQKIRPGVLYRELNYSHSVRSTSVNRLKLEYNGVRCLVPVAARSKAWIGGRLLAGIVGSNPAGDMGVCLLCELCVVR